MRDETTTLVVGGTGKTGRRVVARLRARGLPVRVTSRSGAQPFSWSERASWGPVLRGVARVYLAYAPDLAVPGAAEDVRAFARLAVDSGVQRLVLLSGRGEEGARRGEEAVRGCGAAFTVLRASWFDQNFSEGHLLESVLGGEVALPAGDVAEPFIDLEDLADVAVAALTQDGHAGRTYELTGPRLLTFAEAAAELSQAAGRPVRYVPVSPEQYAEALAAFVPAAEARFLAELFRQVLDGRNASLADGVQRALGRPPRDFADWARDAASTGVWGQRAVAGA